MLKKGETLAIKTSYKKLSFTSSNKNIVKVLKKGKLKAVKAGKAKVTIKSKGKKKIVLSLVVSKKFTQVKKKKMKSSLSLLVGGTQAEKTAKLNAKVNPAKATVKGIKYVSSNKKVAVVNAKGAVTAVAQGKATISAYAKDGRGAKSTCRVTVKKKIVATPAKPQVIDKSNRLSFSTSNRYRSYFSVHVTLPQGVSAANISQIGFGVDMDKNVSFRVYAQAKDKAKELTSSVSTVNDKVTKTDGNTTKHQLTILDQTTRPLLKAGDNRFANVSINAQAKSKLSAYSNNEIDLIFYPHNVKPSFDFYQLTVTQGGIKYTIPLTTTSVHAYKGAKIKVVG